MTIDLLLLEVAALAATVALARGVAWWYTRRR